MSWVPLNNMAGSRRACELCEPWFPHLQIKEQQESLLCFSFLFIFRWTISSIQKSMRNKHISPHLSLNFFLIERKFYRFSWSTLCTFQVPYTIWSRLYFNKTMFTLIVIHVHMGICTEMLLAPLLVIGWNWKYSQDPLMENGVDD